MSGSDIERVLQSISVQEQEVADLKANLASSVT